MLTKSSEKWSKEYAESFTILDPDGWDRTPITWQKVWFEDLITEEEFLKRAYSSTILSKNLEFRRNKND